MTKISSMLATRFGPIREVAIRRLILWMQRDCEEYSFITRQEDDKNLDMDFCIHVQKTYTKPYNTVMNYTIRRLCWLAKCRRQHFRHFCFRYVMSNDLEHLTEVVNISEKKQKTRTSLYVQRIPSLNLAESNVSLCDQLITNSCVKNFTYKSLPVCQIRLAVVMVCPHGAPQVQLSVCARSGWPLRYH